MTGILTDTFTLVKIQEVIDHSSDRELSDEFINRSTAQLERRARERAMKQLQSQERQPGDFTA